MVTSDTVSTEAGLRCTAVWQNGTAVKLQHELPGGLDVKLANWLLNKLQENGLVNMKSVVIICTAQWSLYVPHSGYYMYRTVVTICIAQWLLYVPHRGHYMYRNVVTICTAEWSLYVPNSGHYIHHQFNIHNSTFCPLTVFMCFVWISEQTAIISLYNINWLVFVTEI